MPELPDVEMFRRYADATALGHRVVDVHVFSGRELKSSSRTIKRHLRGARMQDTKRFGKHLFIAVGAEGWLRLHFGMTGFLEYYSRNGRPTHNARVILDFDDHTHLAYICQRHFGEVEWVPSLDAYLRKRRLGPDALALTKAEFVTRVGAHAGAIKNVLMNQAVIAGLGNVYTDEVLFQARLHPLQTSASLSGRQMVHLYRVMRRVLQQSIRYQADPERMPNTWMLLHRRKGATCPRCGGKIRELNVGGRTTWVCESCQSPPW